MAASRLLHSAGGHAQRPRMGPANGHLELYTTPKDLEPYRGTPGISGRVRGSGVLGSPGALSPHLQAKGHVTVVGHLALGTLHISPDPMSYCSSLPLSSPARSQAGKGHGCYKQTPLSPKLAGLGAWHSKLRSTCSRSFPSGFPRARVAARIQRSDRYRDRRVGRW